MSKILVAFFSASGVTAKVAEELARAENVKVDEGKRIGGDISEEDLKIWMEGSLE